MSSDAVHPKAARTILDVEEYKGWLSWICSVDHKQIGIMYIVTSLVFLLAAVSEAVVMRTQLIKPENHWLSPQTYNQVFTMHGTTMIFLFGMPLLIGFMTYFVPLIATAAEPCCGK